jgi:sulfatase maturation enzyme AslB (radical SAM superfamily)
VDGRSLGDVRVPIAMPTARPAGAPAQFHVLAKPTGAICNLDCEYCFLLSKERVSDVRALASRITD